ncbi:hypothetical protein B1748_29665 [Paenibacillus sp. MY03]|uniref:DUF5682 family protein n=2 Tax=Paenibacillus TaxID=44249 RepID=UPI000B3D3896|nr:DUF5682 family protein [Paenibacillus sp. MY03]OUS69905.1 hypothetical protein B1748_29665 [Paenibacillus sp. MY03]
MSGASAAGVRLFGVRHLSPAGAWHLRRFLDEIRPTAVLIEGPSDAADELRHIVHKATKPPIAILAYTEELPVRTVMWPLASYSPEYEALRWASEHGAHASFIDLPSRVVLALQERRGRSSASGPESPAAGDVREEQGLESVGGSAGGSPPVDSSSPLAPEPSTNRGRGRSDDSASDSLPSEERESLYERIAAIAGEPDYDTYWERHYEHNLSPQAYREAILAFSASMREMSIGEERVRAAGEFAYNAVRESYMKRRIADAIADGHEPERIVVVCGAYHASALENLDGAMTDEEIAGLPSVGARRTMMPYSYYRLSSLSGYGAGNKAPGYYELMWRCMEDNRMSELPHYYMSSIARKLRNSGTHRSTAEVIEAVRMAESLAALHDGGQPTLLDLHDAARTLLGRGDLGIVAEALAGLDVGTGIGSLAEGVSQTPVQDDLNRLLKQLKLEKYRTGVAQDLSLDLRENRRVKSEEAAFLDLRRSYLLHRLELLGISLAKKMPSSQQGANWAEHWVLQWTPEAEIQTVEATLLGETIEVAAGYTLAQKLAACASIAEASSLIRTACLCGMASQLEAGTAALEGLAADSRDVVQLAEAVRQLSVIISYGDVRRMDTAPLIPMLEKLFLRSSLFLLEASACNDEAATEMVAAINGLNGVAQEHAEAVDEALWVRQLEELSARDDLNPRLSGFACAILMERGVLSAADCEQEVSRRLSPGVPAELGSGWFEGLAQRNRYALVSRMSLWEQLNDYMAGLDKEQFARALVFLRRAFSVFSAREKVMVAEVLGELWGVQPEQAAELLGAELSEKESKQIEELNDFDFEDF